MCTYESIIVHSGPRPKSALAVDASVSVPVRMVLAKTDVKNLPAMSCLCVHAARSSYQVDIILGSNGGIVSYRSHSLAIIRWLVVHACTFMNIKLGKYLPVTLRDWRIILDTS